MLRVGLTGSIGVGKSFVSGVFAELGCHVLDADQVAREVVQKHSRALHDVVSKFGEDILDQNGELDRGKLGSIVFADEAKRSLLNSILHPYIIAKQDEHLAQYESADPTGIGIVDAALMIESGGYRRFDKLVVVYCRPEVQLERLMTRNGFSRDEAEQRIAAQMPQEQKKQFADYLIDTSDGFGAARENTTEVYRLLLADSVRDHS